MSTALELPELEEHLKELVGITMPPLEKLLVQGPSKLGDFFKCHRIFEYKYVFGFRDRGIRAIFGSEQHNMVERFWFYNYKSADALAGYHYRLWKMIKLGQEFSLEFLGTKKLEPEQQLDFEETTIRILRPKAKELARLYKEDKRGRTGFDKLRTTLLNLREKYGNVVWRKGVQEKAIPYIWGNYAGRGATILKDFYERHIDERRDLEERRNVELERLNLSHLKQEKRRKALRELEIFPLAEWWFEFPWGGYDLRGRIDRIELEDNSLRAVDYKTGRSLPEEEDILLQRSRDHQSTIYTLALEELCKKYGFNNAGFAIYHLRSGEVIPVERKLHHFELLEDALRYTKAKIIEMEEKRKDSEEVFVYPQQVGGHCPGCDFRGVCEEEEKAKRGNEKAIKKYFERIESIGRKRTRRGRKRHAPGQQFLFS